MAWTWQDQQDKANSQSVEIRKAQSCSRSVLLQCEQLFQKLEKFLSFVVAVLLCLSAVTWMNSDWWGWSQYLLKEFQLLMKRSHMCRFELLMMRLWRSKSCCSMKSKTLNWWWEMKCTMIHSTSFVIDFVIHSIAAPADERSYCRHGKVSKPLSHMWRNYFWMFFFSVLWLLMLLHLHPSWREFCWLVVCVIYCMSVV